MAGFRDLRAADGMLFTGSPPFMIHLLAPLKVLWRGRLVYRITDFHPECLIAAQPRPSRALGLLLALTNFWRRRIDGFEVLGIDQKRRLGATGVPPERIALVRDGSPVSFTGSEALEPLPAALVGSCVLLYAGNYGVAHEVDTVAEGYARHHREGSGRVRLWLSATGAGADDLARRLAGAGPAVPSLAAGAARTIGRPAARSRCASRDVEGWFRRLCHAVEDLCLHRVRPADPVRRQRRFGCRSSRSLGQGRILARAVRRCRGVCRGP